MTNRTLEQRIKFDHGLPIGQSLVSFTLGDRSRLALVEIGTRGQVYYCTEPREGDMYHSWTKVRGDMSLTGKGAVMVNAWRNTGFMEKFKGEPVASIPVTIEASK